MEKCDIIYVQYKGDFALKRVTKREFEELSKNPKYRNRLIRRKYGFYFVD